MLTTALSLDLITRDLDRSLQNVADQAVVARETAYYKENISNVKSIDDFVGNDRLFRYAMKAHGLSDMSYAKAFMRKVLEGGTDDSESFANSLADRRYREFAEVFNFARYDEATTAFDRTQQGTVDKYYRQTLEEDAGGQNEAVRLALYFERKASSLTNAYEILADRALLQVVQTALGIPAAASQQNIDRQAEAITDRIDFEDFKDPDKVKTFLQRFSNLWDLSNPQQAPTVPSVLVGTGAQYGVNINVLTQLQSLKLGGR